MLRGAKAARVVIFSVKHPRSADRRGDNSAKAGVMDREDLLPE